MRWILAIALGFVTIPQASARDMFSLGGRVYTFEEIAPTREAAAASIAVRMGLQSAADARTNGALVAMRQIIVRDLPGLLGSPCDTSATAHDVQAYARWWDSKTAEFLSSATPATPDQSGEQQNSVIGPTNIRNNHDPADPTVIRRANEAVGRSKLWACVAARYPSSPFGADARFPAPGQGERIAPIALGEDWPPVDGCLNVQPVGAIWDLMAEGEQRGVLVFIDRYARNRTSTTRNERPSGVRFGSPACIDAPPWATAR